MLGSVMSPQDASPDTSPHVSSEEDEPFAGMSGGDLVNGSKQPSERDLAEAQMQQESYEASGGESMSSADRQ